ncbi:DUF6232 family protein [Streptacidiphilus sp. P02-A3a]|uniref:DUF6232 family protein n=1 Tax=Streptacidiphilus sp. P02-A3a TaxID=2704468 RepID=UPI0015F7B65D|nr:DUF6232 family protein [Streptacidiphilus sp. P02-A3a]QMU72567.1 hypothetical protein GXP74_34285 [Streptacidiphilus sp. P02-A3a]
MSKRILWIGAAAYPLATIVRVCPTQIVPRYAAAIRRFLKFTGIVILAAIGIYSLSYISTGLNSSGDDGGGGGQHSAGGGLIVALAVVAVVVYFLVDTWPVLSKKPLFALTIDTAGPPTALMAWQDQRSQVELASKITYAIEHPEQEFHTIVHNHQLVDMRQFRFGDDVNIYGGQGNTGISK